MVGARVLPLPPQTVFERAMVVGVRIVDKLARYWNGGGNYLSASGRCLAFRTKQIKKFHIPDEVVNGDMYFYLENKRTGGVFARVKRAVVYIRCPQQLKDQIGPSSRYQYSRSEMITYFGPHIQSEYAVPKAVLLRAVIQEFLRHPFSALSYIAVYLYTRVKRQSRARAINPIWKVDISTKQVTAS